MIHEKTFRERLNFLIGEFGCELFERRTGISEKSIRQYLNGDSLPTLKSLEKIAEANGVTVGWLIGEDAFLPVAEMYFEQKAGRSMREIAQWINEQKDGIDYWEVLKARLAQEYPAFLEWLKERHSQSTPPPTQGGDHE